MTPSHAIDDLLAPYQPRLPMPELVRAVNQIYHRFEAANYDRRHPEIHRRLPPLWRAMASIAREHHGERTWRVLNIGCGTGFEAEQLVRAVGPGRIAHLTCYDPSPEMLARCRAKIAPLCAQAVFCTEPGALPDASYNVLISNSLLHHLPHPLAQIAALLPRLERDAIWLAGHEPSRRFYTNPACLDVYRRFEQATRRRKLLSPASYARAVARWLGVSREPASRTAAAAVRQGLFGRRPSVRAIARIVDIHVAHSAAEAAQGRGFDIEHWRQELAWAWRCAWFTSYGFMGEHYEDDLAQPWAAAARDLAARFPADGANFCSVWERWR